VLGVPSFLMSIFRLASNWLPLGEGSLRVFQPYHITHRIDRWLVVWILVAS
jgi:hypothetical protein